MHRTLTPCLISWLALSAGACIGGGGIMDDPADGGDTPGDDGGDESDDGEPASPDWGRLANPGHEGERIVATLFFAGQARDGSKQYEFTATPNTAVYTQRPTDPSELRWTSDPSTRFAALDDMVDRGINAVFLSHWGPRGSDTWARWAPMQTSTYAHDEVLSAIGDRPLLVVPFFESSPDWRFRSEFPGIASDPAPGLVERIVDLADRVLHQPADPAWPEHWARIRGPDGQPRYAVAIIQATSDSAITDEEYVEAFDAVAAEVEAVTGVQVGFLLDALSPASDAPGAFLPDPSRTAQPMSRSSSVLGISCFAPEIWTSIADDPGDRRRLAWKRDFMVGWTESGVPTLVDVSPGYDATLVFPGSTAYGQTSIWRDRMLQMVIEFGDDGVLLNAWNGYTEGMVIVPTVERGDSVYRWAADVAAAVALP